MDQNPFEDRMTAAILQMHREMLRRETRGPGDQPNAMRRLEARYGIAYWTQWGLRYNPPVEIRDRSLIERIRQAYLDMLARSVRHDLEAFRVEDAKGAKDAALQDLVAESEALLARISAAKIAKAQRGREAV